MTEADVVVVGGGPTGIGASIAAARAGAKTLLIERNGYLGGMTTAGLVAHWDPIGLMEVTGLPKEIHELLVSAGGARDFPYDKIEMPFTFWEAGCGIDAEIFKQLVLELTQGAGVDFMLHSFVGGVVRERDRLSGVVVHSKSGDRLVRGTMFIDATGDGDLSALSGISFKLGSESGELMAATLSFNVAGVEVNELKSYLLANPDEFGLHPRLGKFLRNVDGSAILQGFRSLIRRGQETGQIDFLIPEQGIGMARLPRDGEFHINATREIGIDGTNVDHLTSAELAQRRNVHRLFRFMQEYVPGYRHAYITGTASQIGIRETRRIECEYFLTLEDVRGGRQFEDAILQAKWAHSDVHSGKDMKWEFELIEGPYQVPYRCLIPRGVNNVITAGRSIWVERSVIGSLRIQPMCMLTGQAAGVAAAIAAAARQTTRDVDIHRVQKELRRQGVYIPQP